MSSSSYPIKAIYDTAGTTVTGLGEFTSGDLVAFDVLPTGTSSTEVAVGNHNHDLVYSKLDHAHDAVYSKKPSAGAIVDHVALFTDIAGNLKDSNVAFADLTQCSSATTLNNLAVFSNASGDIKDSTLGLGLVVRGPDYATSQFNSNTLPVFSGSGNTLIASNVSGMAKLSSGVVSAATKGTDYVEPGTTTSFSKPQKPSFTTASLTTTTIAYNWDLTTYQTLHLTIATGVSATLSLASSLTTDLVGLSYRLIVSGGATTLTLPSAIKWALSTTPTLTNSTGKADIFTFEVMSLGGSYVLVEVGRNLNVG